MILPPWVKKYVCIPFAEYNCYSLLRKIYKDELGINLPHFDDSSSLSIRKAFDREMANFKNWREVKKEAEKDIIILRVKGYPFHIGIVIKKGWMLHTESVVGESIIECYERSTWEHRVIGFRRYFAEG